MEQYNLQPESKDPHEFGQLSVAILGFEAIDEQSFRRFFQVARPYQRKYTAATRAADTESSDILMVNYDNPAALTEKNVLVSKYPHIQVVAVSKGPLEEPPEHHIRGMLFAARVLNVLDKVIVTPALKEESAAPTEVEEIQTVAEVTSHPASDIIPESVTESVAHPVVETTQELVAESSTQPDAEPTALQVVETTTKQAPELQPEQVQVVPEQTDKPALAESSDPAPTLPSAITNVSFDATPAPSLIEPVPIATVGYRALVVDDSIAIQKSLELNLASLTQISLIDFADSGESALEKAEALQYDLIFLDVMMPGIDGYETCTRLRKKPEYKKTPIIMVSGKTSPLDEVKGVMAGCTTYLTKPVQQEAFQKLSIRVMSWLDKQKQP